MPGRRLRNTLVLDVQERLSELTYHGNDLCLESKLVAETTGKVADLALAIAGHIGRLADVVEHVTRCEEEDGDDANASPQVAVLHKWENSRREGHNERQRTKSGDRSHDDPEPVGRADDIWVRATRDLSLEPLVDWVGAVKAGSCQSSTFI